MQNRLKDGVAFGALTVMVAIAPYLFFSAEALADSLSCPRGMTETYRGDAGGRDQGFILCQNPINGLFQSFKLKNISLGRKRLVAGNASKDPAAALSSVNGLALTQGSNLYKVALAAGVQAQQKWRMSEYGDIASDKALQDMKDKTAAAGNVLAIGNAVVRVGAGGNTTCTWLNPDADAVSANAGNFECGKDKYCQRPVKCTMTVETQSFSFTSTAKCKLSEGQTCIQDANACAAQNFNDKRGMSLPEYDPTKQVTGAK